MNREHELLDAFAEALREAQITGLAFIRVNANGHVQALPSDRVRISVIQAVEERTAAAAHQECGDATPPRPFLKPPCDHLWVVGLAGGPMPEHLECVKYRKQKPLPEECDHLWQQHLGEPEFRECIRCGRVEDVYE